MHKFKSLGINNEFGLKQICMQFAKISLILYGFCRNHICRNIKNAFRAVVCKEPFIYYVSTFLGILDPLPPTLSCFRTEDKKKKCHFLTLPSPLQVLTYVICEWSSREIMHSYIVLGYMQLSVHCTYLH